MRIQIHSVVWDGRQDVQESTPILTLPDTTTRDEISAMGRAEIERRSVDPTKQGTSWNTIFPN